MPIYEYRCAKCGFQQEYLQRLSEPPLTRCPECGKKSFNKMVTAAGFQLKGTGWYATDFKNSGAKGKTGQKTEAASKESQSGETGAKDGAKESAKTESAKTESGTAASPSTGS